MNDKLFHLDKNYLLKEAQHSIRPELIKDFIKRAKKQYQYLHNPLGLIDQTMEVIHEHQLHADCPDFHGFYKKIAAIYRYKFGDNQLPILWDGRSHLDFYKDEWEDFFVRETNQMFLQPSFLKMVLEISIFSNPDDNKDLLLYRLSGFIRDHFNMQVFKKKGVVELKIA